ncbi:MAG: hypothetical protein ACYTEQ_29620, partial [Planctomycetota bacterium]
MPVTTINSINSDRYALLKTMCHWWLVHECRGRSRALAGPRCPLRAQQATPLRVFSTEQDRYRFSFHNPA